MKRVRAMLWVVGLLAIAAARDGRAAVADAPSTASSIFYQANECYRNGKFDEAVSGYRRILQLGLENGTLYYNLGNAFLKSGQRGEALWAYLKAKAWLPRDADVQANLEYAQALLQPGVNDSVKPSRLIQWLSLRRRFATSELAGWVSVWVWVLVLAWGVFVWRPQHRRVVRPIVWLSGIVAAVFLTALVVQTVWLDGVPRAVIVHEPVDAKFAPQATGTTYFTLPEGTLVRLLGDEFGWAQVERADGRTGWVPKHALNAL